MTKWFLDKKTQSIIRTVLVAVFITIVTGTVAVFALVQAMAALIRGEDSTPIIGGSVAVLAIVIGLLLIAREQTRLATRTQQRIQEAEDKVKNEPAKSQYSWDLARVTLDAYFSRNLSQVTYIFILSVVVMLVGFSGIVWGISQALKTSQPIAPATITALAGVVTEFIGATFILVYRSTLHQALSYMRSLERINSIGMAMQILETLPDNASENDLKSKTKAMLVELVVKQVSSIPSTSEVGDNSNA